MQAARLLLQRVPLEFLSKTAADQFDVQSSSQSQIQRQNIGLPNNIMKQLLQAWAVAHSLRRALADPSYVAPNGSCTSPSQVGKAIYCCDGACLDGTSIFDKTGLCGSFANQCADTGSPGCSANQVFYGNGDTNFDPGLGDCYLPALHVCQWQQDKWAWQCCDCPPGYVSLNDDCANAGTRNEYECFGCTSADETVQYNDQAGVFVCKGPGFEKTACNLVEANENLLGAVGLGLNLLGGLCPLGFQSLSDKIQAAGLALGDVYAWASGFANPTSGISGTEIGAASAVVGTISAIAVGAGLAAGGLEAGFIYEVACGAVSGLSFASTAVSAFHDHDPACADKMSRRDHDKTVKSGVDRTRPRRAIIQKRSNPCTDFLGYFPGDYSVLTDLQTQCEDISLYAAADTLVADVANTTAVLQQMCNQLTGGQNGTLFDLPGLLSAIQAFVPYCDTSRDSGSSASVSSTSKSSHSSSPSRSTGLERRSSLSSTTLGHQTSSTVRSSSHSSTSSRSPSSSSAKSSSRSSSKSSSQTSSESSSHSSILSTSRTSTESSSHSTQPTSYTSTKSSPHASTSSSFHTSTRFTSHSSSTTSSHHNNHKNNTKKHHT